MDAMNEHISTYPVQRGMTQNIRNIYNVIAGRGYIAGSYAAYMVAQDAMWQPNDVDIFATSLAHADALAADLESRFGLYRGIETDVAYSLMRNEFLNDDATFLPLQVVKPHPDWKTFPDDVIGSFDMDICRAMLISEDCILADENAGKGMGKLLRINNPLRSLKRVLKYHQRGVHFSEWELLKLFQSWQQMQDDDKAAMIARYNPFIHMSSSVEDSGDGYDWYDEDDWFEGE
jgi:hypothetical protein